MPQFFGSTENIPQITRSSNTLLLIGNTYQGRPSAIRVGGQMYYMSGNFVVDVTTGGFGGLDTGAINSNGLYYIYAVVSTGGALGYTVSLNGPTTGPVGFTAWKEVGRFRTFFGSSAIAEPVNTIIGNNTKASEESTWVTYTPSLIGITGGVTTRAARYRRTKDSMDLEWFFDVGAVTGTGNVGSSLPNGLSFDTVYSTFASIPTSRSLWFDASASQYVPTESIPLSTTGFGFIKSTAVARLVVADLASGDFVRLLVNNLIVAEYVGLFD